jgi:hypothetical protein
VSIVYDGDFNSARLNGAPVVVQDFADTPEVTSFVAPVMQRMASYSPLALTASTAYLAATWFYVGDKGFTDRGADVAQFSREFAKIPATRTVPGGSLAYTFPGMVAATGGTAQTITAATFGATSTTFTANTHGFVAGDIISLSFAASGGLIGTTPFVYYNLVSVASATTNQFVVNVTAPSGATFTTGVAQKYTPARNPRTIKASTIIQYDYALPTVTSGIANALDFTAFPEFRVVGASGIDEVENVLSNTTQPTLSEYFTAISNGTLLVAESAVNVWKGRILERRTVYVKAQ